MEDVNISKFRAQVVRSGSTPASPGFVVSEGQNPVDPSGSGQNHLPVTIATASTGLSITESQVLGGAGTVGQYIRGDGSLADFPATTGGGSSVSYYLNGSVSQGTIGGVAYKELNRTPVFGAGTDISINADGYIASFITDALDPNKLLIPGGNWNFETYFSASSSGGSPSFYIELYKYNGTTFTLIATSSSSPELIAFGTNLNPYFSTLAVPETVLALTDRLALRYYVTHSGRTITLHTENGHLCQVITTFTTGLTALNGLTNQVQFFAVGTSGTDFAISSATDTHTFNLPTASATNRGALSSADWTTFNGKQNALTNPVTGTGASGRVAYWNGTNSITSDADLLFDGSNLTVNGAGTFGSNTFKVLSISDAGGAGWATTGGASISPQLYLFGTGTSAIVQSYINNVAKLEVSNNGISVNGTGIFSSSLTAGGTQYLVNTNTGTNQVYQRITNTGGDLILGINANTGAALAAGGLAYATSIYNNTNTAIQFGTNAVFNMTIAAGGNVGIGVNNPVVKFQINDGTNINLGIKIGQTDSSAVMLNAFNDGAIANIPLEFRATKFGFQLGNVGIGTTTPDVTGFGWRTLTIRGGTTSGEAGVLELQSPSTTGAANLGIIAFLDGSNRNAQISVQRDSSTTTGNMLFYTNAGAGIIERMRISSGGSVGINNTSPMNSVWGSDTSTKQLSINGSSYAVINLEGSTGRKYSMGVGDGNFYMCYDNTAGRHNIIVNTSGNVLIADSVNAQGFNTNIGTVSVPNLTWVTIYTIPSTQAAEGVYSVYGHYNDDSGGMAFIQVLADRSSTRSINGSNSSVQLQISGRNIQVLQIYGVTLSIQYSVLWQKLR